MKRDKLELVRKYRNELELLSDALVNSTPANEAQDFEKRWGLHDIERAREWIEKLARDDLFRKFQNSWNYFNSIVSEDDIISHKIDNYISTLKYRVVRLSLTAEEDKQYMHDLLVWECEFCTVGRKSDVPFYPEPKPSNYSSAIA